MQREKDERLSFNIKYEVKSYRSLKELCVAYEVPYDAIYRRIKRSGITDAAEAFQEACTWYAEKKRKEAEGFAYKGVVYKSLQNCLTALALNRHHFDYVKETLPELTDEQVIDTLIEKRQKNGTRTMKKFVYHGEEYSSREKALNTVGVYPSAFRTLKKQRLDLTDEQIVDELRERKRKQERQFMYHGTPYRSFADCCRQHGVAYKSYAAYYKGRGLSMEGYITMKVDEKQRKGQNFEFQGKIYSSFAACCRSFGTISAEYYSNYWADGITKKQFLRKVAEKKERGLALKT